MSFSDLAGYAYGLRCEEVYRRRRELGLSSESLAAKHGSREQFFFRGRANHRRFAYLALLDPGKSAKPAQHQNHLLKTYSKAILPTTLDCLGTIMSLRKLIKGWASRRRWSRRLTTRLFGWQWKKHRISQGYFYPIEDNGRSNDLNDSMPKKQS